MAFYIAHGGPHYLAHVTLAKRVSDVSIVLLLLALAGAFVVVDEEGNAPLPLLLASPFLMGTAAFSALLFLPLLRPTVSPLFSPHAYMFPLTIQNICFNAAAVGNEVTHLYASCTYRPNIENIENGSGFTCSQAPYPDISNQIAAGCLLLASFWGYRGLFSNCVRILLLLEGILMLVVSFVMLFGGGPGNVLLLGDEGGDGSLTVLNLYGLLLGLMLLVTYATQRMELGRLAAALAPATEPTLGQ